MAVAPWRIMPESMCRSQGNCRPRCPVHARRSYPNEDVRTIFEARLGLSLPSAAVRIAAVLPSMQLPKSRWLAAPRLQQISRIKAPIIHINPGFEGGLGTSKRRHVGECRTDMLAVWRSLAKSTNGARGGRNMPAAEPMDRVMAGRVAAETRRSSFFSFLKALLVPGRSRTPACPHRHTAGPLP